MNPYVFLVGCPRSGTTLLGRLVDAHPELAVVHESRWLARTFQRRDGLTADGAVTAALAPRLSDERPRKPFRIGVDDLASLVAAYEGEPFAAFASALFDRYGALAGKSLVGDKSPGYVRYLDLLHRLWPAARFVHIVRDGRDVCLSVLDWRKGATSFDTFDDDPVTTTAVWWEWYVRLGREQGRALPSGHYHELRYESLVAEPERECRRLCDFLGVPFDHAMLRFHEGRTRTRRGRSAKSAWLPVTPGLRDWTSTLAPDDVRRFDAAAGPLLAELGYAAGGEAASGAQRERAAVLRAQFAQQARARERPLPAAWTNGSG